MSKSMKEFVKDDIDTMEEYVREIINFFVQVFTHKMTYALVVYDGYFASLILVRFLICIPIIEVFLTSKLFGTVGWLLALYFTSLTLHQRYRRKILQQDWRDVKYDQSSKLH